MSGFSDRDPLVLHALALVAAWGHASGGRRLSVPGAIVHLLPAGPRWDRLRHLHATLRAEGPSARMLELALQHAVREGFLSAVGRDLAITELGNLARWADPRHDPHAEAADLSPLTAYPAATLSMAATTVWFAQRQHLPIQAAAAHALLHEPRWANVATEGLALATTIRMAPTTPASRTARAQATAPPRAAQPIVRHALPAAVSTPGREHEMEHEPGSRATQAPPAVAAIRRKLAA